MPRALDLTTDKDRLMDYFNALGPSAEKRAEFREALDEVDHEFVSRVLAGLPDRNDQCVYRRGLKARVTRTVTRRAKRNGRPN